MRSAPPPDLPLTYSTQLAGRVVSYRVRVSLRARSWRLSVHPHTGLTVTIPHRSRIDINALLNAHQKWIRRSLQQIARRPIPRRIPLVHGSQMLFQGTLIRLELTCHGQGLPQFDPQQAVLRVSAAGTRALSHQIEEWYRRQAERIVHERLIALNAAPGYRFNRVSIRDQRTRWGSCSVGGSLAFNWRLVMAPLAILDSVVAHELTHLVDPTHAPSFWRRLSVLDPTYDAHRQWLTQWGPWLALGVEPIPLAGLVIETTKGAPRSAGRPLAILPTEPA